MRWLFISGIVHHCISFDVDTWSKKLRIVQESCLQSPDIMNNKGKVLRVIIWNLVVVFMSNISVNLVSLLLWFSLNKRTKREFSFVYIFIIKGERTFQLIYNYVFFEIFDNNFILSYRVVYLYLYIYVCFWY